MLQNKSNWDLWNIYQSTDNMHCQCQILQTFLNREGLYSRIENITIEERLENLVQKAGTHNKWYILLLRIPNGKRIWFWYKTAAAPAPAADANYLRICKQYKNSSYSQQSGSISHIVWSD